MTGSFASASGAEADASGNRRGRILAVGDSAATAELDHAGDRSIVHVANLFDAVGELSIARPHDPIDAVLIDSSLAGAATTQAIQTLRQFDPAIQLVLVASEDACQLDPPLCDQFDHRLTAPLTRNMIEAIFAGGVHGGNSVDAPQAETERAYEIEVERHTIVNGRGENRSPDVPRPAMTEKAAGTSRQVVTRGESLGDIDLVDAVMNDPNGVRDCAVALIRQQTGWRGAELLPDSVASGIAVMHEGVFFGTLVADAPRETIEPWAQWLGHWLALDAAHRRNRTLSLTDEMTGAWNRRYFDSFLKDCIRLATERRRPVSVMVLDIDDFKLYNDTFGHAAGDEILRETVRLLTSVIRKGDRVCRIGGDEFAVIFADIEGPREPGSDHPHSVEQIAKRFQDEICQMHFPKLGIEAPGTLSVSAGLATYPWDGHDARSLLEHADQLALESKRRGKNAITMGPGAQRNCCKH